MTENTAPVLTAEERAAVKEAAKESRTRVARKKISPEQARAAGESDVRAKIAEMDGEDGPLAEALHPTAAVAGTPTREAVAISDVLEQMDRGRYAGCVSRNRRIAGTSTSCLSSST